MNKQLSANGYVEKTLNAFGIQVLVRVQHGVNSSRALAETMLARLSAAWKDSPEPIEFLDERPLVDLGEVSESNFEEIHSLLSTQVTLASLKAHAGSSLMLHAGGIARDDGSVAVIVGPSGRGKTTTVLQLGRYFGYVSDETIAITGKGEILPYRKPLSVMTEGHSNKLQIAPSDLGLLPLPERRLYIGGLSLLKRAEDGVSESSVTNIGFAEGVASVIEQSSYLVELERPLAAVCAAAASSGGFKLLTLGEPSRIHEVAEELFVSGPTPKWERVMPNPQSAFSTAAAYLATGVLDAVECEDGTVVFTESRQAIVLEGIGPQLWRAACAAENWEQTIMRIELCYGPAPDGNSKVAIQEAASELVKAGILRISERADGPASHS